MFLHTMLQIQNPNVVIIHKIKMKYVNIVKTSWAALESNSLLSWSFLSVDFGEDVLLVLDVTGGKQSQLLVRLTWTGLDLDWSLTTMRAVMIYHSYQICDNHRMALKKRRYPAIQVVN